MIIGIEVRHFKAYKGKRFIPIGYEHSFVSYTGENGVGKSSILESLNTFFNNKDWLLTKKEKYADSYICPVFLIPKSIVTRLKTEFEVISEYFWNIDKKDKNNLFFDIRDGFDDELKEKNFLIFLGEDYYREFQYPFGDKNKKEFEKYLLEKGIQKFNGKKFIKELKDLYSYVYLPVELDIESFTKIETDEMQKIFDKELRDEIKDALKDVNLDKSGGLNQKLNNFIEEIEEKLDHEYCYVTGKQRNNKVTKTDLVEKILEVYFQKRFLNKKEGGANKMIKELSAGEKRQALINLVYAFISRGSEREKQIIIGIDEPENSLHTTICYEQFEKLKVVSHKAQTLITTHWYGFIPVIDKGLVHFLRNKKSEVEFFDKIDLYDYSFQTKKIPNDFSLKSTNDLVQSIFYSLKANKPYNWLICEGISDKNYLSYFLKDEIKDKKLRIIAVGGIGLVKKFYKYLSLPIEENIEDMNKGKIFCLTDTDSNLFTKDIEQKSNKVEKVLIIKRLTKEVGNTTGLIKFEIEEKKDSIDIEQSLNPTLFKRTMDELGVDNKYKIDDKNIQNINGNTTKENLRNFDYLEYFKDERVKTKFSKKYIEVMVNEQNSVNFIPSWIEEIKNFFNS